MYEWSDRKKWWMDIIKYSVTFFLGALATILFLDDREDQREKNRKAWEAEFILKKDEIYDLDKSAHLYSAAATDAFVELYNHDPKKPGETLAMRRYENVTYDNFTFAIERIKRRCEADSTCL